MTEVPDPALSALRQAEARMLTRRLGHADPAGAVAEALREAGDGRVPPALAAAGARIGAAVEAHGTGFAPGTEPDYHDRHHQAEATLAMGWLAGMARRAGLIDAHTALLGVLAMAGHDLLHDGNGTVAPGTLEARSADATLALLPGLPEPDRAEIRRLILLTDLHAPAPADLLGRLAREADLFGSLTPCLGWRLSAALAREILRCGMRGADTIATHAGRLALLRAVPAPTDAARRLGLGEARDMQIAAMADAGSPISPEAGAAALDRLPPEEARRRYRAALRARGMPDLPA